MCSRPVGDSVEFAIGEALYEIGVGLMAVPSYCSHSGVLAVEAGYYQV